MKHASLAWAIAAFVFTQIAAAGGVYAAIRADLSGVKVRTEITERRVERVEDQLHQLQRR